MPVRTKKVGAKYRVVDPNGRLARNKRGTPIDGGGHKTKKGATRQVQAVNLNLIRSGKIKPKGGIPAAARRKPPRKRK